MTHITEDQLEQAALNWFRGLGYQAVFGPDIAPPPDGVVLERDNYRQTILLERLRTRLQDINPAIPGAAIDDAIHQILAPNLPTVIQINRQFHRWLRDGVKVQYQRDNETVGDLVYLADFSEQARNDWLVVNQFSIQGPQRTRRPDIIVFLNGLPVAVLELKNPADEEADIWKAFDQLQTYKEQIPDLFNTNEILIISDGVTARMGSLTSDKERFSTWRTIDGYGIKGWKKRLRTPDSGLSGMSLNMRSITEASFPWHWEHMA